MSSNRELDIYAAYIILQSLAVSNLIKLIADRWQNDQKNPIYSSLWQNVLTTNYKVLQNAT